MNKALEFYNLKPNYTKDELKKVRSNFIKETVDIDTLKKGTSYYNLLIENILDKEFILLEEIFDFERSLVYSTKPNGKYNDLTEKYIIKVQYVKTKEELHELENNYYQELKLLKSNPKKKDNYLEKEKESFEEVLDTEFLDTSIQEVRILINRYRKILGRIKKLNDLLKLENSYQEEFKKLDILDKSKFQEELEIVLKSNSLFSSLGKYKELLNKVKTKEELDNLHNDFLREYSLLLKKNKNYVKELKKGLKKMLDRRLRDNDSIENREFFKELCFRIDATSDEEMNNVLPLFNKIYFQDKEEKQVLNEFEPLIFINKFSGDVVSLVYKDNEQSKFYSLKRHSYYDITNDRFQFNFISLKSFLRKGEYVGDRKVTLISDNKDFGIRFPNQSFIYYNDGVMLAFEHTDLEDKFYFYPETNFKLKNASWSYNDKNIFEPVQGLFKDIDYTYQTILNNFKKRLNNDIKDSDIKRR